MSTHARRKKTNFTPPEHFILMQNIDASLETVLKTALLGTARENAAPQLSESLERFATSSGVSSGNPEATGNKAEVEAEVEVEIRLLNAATALSFCRRAGTLPLKSEKAVIAPCPPESQPYFSPRAASLLESCMSEQRDLMPQALAWAAQSGHIAPPSLLPSLLDLGRGSRELRRDLAPILGERGRWLAQLNAEWNNVAAPLETDLQASWQEGETAARREALLLQRQRDPILARAWLEADWKQESAKERAEWTALLEDGLSPEDEPFLETILDDKSKEVRTSAIRLLERLPDSRLVMRAKAELEPLLRCNTTMWNTRKTLQVELPAQWRPEWARDGLEEKTISYNASKKLGERAAWLHRFLSRVPPEHWETRFDAAPAKIVAGAPKEWRELLFGAWWEAARKHQNIAWAAALLTACEPGTTSSLSFAGFTADYADAVALLLFERKDQDLNGNNSLATLLDSHPGPFSMALAQRFLREVRDAVPRWHRDAVKQGAQPNQSHNWLRVSLPALADKMPIEIAPEAARALAIPDGAEVDSFWQAWTPVIQRFLARLQLRRDLKTEFGANIVAHNGGA